MQLVTFEQELVGRLNRSGQAQAKSYHELNARWLFGTVVRTGDAEVAYRITKGSGTGDPKPTEDEQALHAEYVTRAASGKADPSSRGASAAAEKISALIRDVLAAEPLPGAVGVVGPGDSDKPGVKVVFNTDAEIYVRPVL
ncbi:hypothetical protein ABT369_38960 [Dactylosporangium sp. NPDC000244]|uniref:hypothetical protein n=1 Tax=Dactylosporangium sp. NPDC000244 TaxID=3154365 RepID=UPI003332EA8C